MRKKSIIAAMTITGVLLSIVGMQLVEVAEAQPHSYYDVPSMPFIAITSPTNQTVYKNSTFPLNICVGAENLEYNYSSQTIVYETIQWVNYSLDGASYPFLNWTLPYQTNTVPPINTYANATLSDLSDGVHSLTVYGETTFGTNMSSNIIFWVYANGEAIPSPLPLPTQHPTTSPSPTPTATTLLSPSVPEFPTWTALPLTLTAAVLALFLVRKRK